VVKESFNAEIGLNYKSTGLVWRPKVLEAVRDKAEAAANAGAEAGRFDQTTADKDKWG
jgi:hypothetical protein